MRIPDQPHAPADLLPAIDRMFALSARKIRLVEDSWLPLEGAPVFTMGGCYTARGWTEWTQGFQFGSALLQFDATGDREFLELGRARTLERMTPHLTATGVHDHGFNNVSTFGTLWRLAVEQRFEVDGYERDLYALALKVSGAVQASRWTAIPGSGFIYSFSGPHSLFIDTMRTLRALALAHQLGHELSIEQDAKVSLLQRLVEHARTTAEFAVYYGRGRDIYDVRGRVAHESVFNPTNGSYRGPGTQQGYSPFSTWTRGLAWAMLGFAEQLEFIATVPDDALHGCGGRDAIEGWMTEAACAASDHYLDQATAADGVPYWDTGAPGLLRLDGWQDRPADPLNGLEPVDSSAAAIAAQALIRLGRVLDRRVGHATRYARAGLAILATLLDDTGPYLSTGKTHQGLLLHAVYHRPNGWDATPSGTAAPRGESTQWGDYHLREAGLLVRRLATQQPYLTFFGPA
ncbi:MAG: glycoside hydrolase family 88 protein [Acidobacteria bacterium]|nr:glycoside hydrolase family 88 protein [Acidobacteriota bacterium]